MLDIEAILAAEKLCFPRKRYSRKDPEPCLNRPVTSLKPPHKSYYSVVIAVAKRAREITQEAEDNNEIIVEKPVDLAVQDFVDEKYKIIEPDEIDGLIYRKGVFALLAQLALENTTYRFDKPFTYSVPQALETAVRPGVRVTVPFGAGNRTRVAMVLYVV